MIQLAEPFARQVLHEGAGKYGLLVAAYGVGAITRAGGTAGAGGVQSKGGQAGPRTDRDLLIAIAISVPGRDLSQPAKPTSAS